MSIVKTGDPKDMSNLRVLSLFSGCGGMDLGLEGGFNVPAEMLDPETKAAWTEGKSRNGWIQLKRTRFDTVFANDIRPDAKAAWVEYFGRRGKSAEIYKLDSIVDLVKRFREGSVEVFPRNIDVVTGGFPCQDFSVAGKRLGFRSHKSHDGELREVDAPSVESRGQLYMWMREVIEITMPKVFIAENVKGLANLDDVKEVIQSDFASIGGNGYVVVPAKILHAGNYGIPQSRERVIFIGFKKTALTAAALHGLTSEVIPNIFDPYPGITHQIPNQSLKGLLPHTPVSVALAGLEEPEQAIDLAQKSHSRAKYMGRHVQGQTEIKLNGLGPTIRSEHHGNIEFRRLSAEHGGKISTELENGLSERRLTVRECARIQTFPDDYQFILDRNGSLKNVSASDAYKLIGNAVPPLLAFSLARNLQEKWPSYFGKTK
jgi:DNA (cytosine-5)-methyltransferase 1